MCFPNRWICLHPDRHAFPAGLTRDVGVDMSGWCSVSRGREAALILALLPKDILFIPPTRRLALFLKLRSEYSSIRGVIDPSDRCDVRAIHLACLHGQHICFSVFQTLPMGSILRHHRHCSFYHDPDYRRPPNMTDGTPVPVPQLPSLRVPASVNMYIISLEAPNCNPDRRWTTGPSSCQELLNVGVEHRLVLSCRVR